MDNLITASDSFNEIIAKVAEGEGTLGALIADPELYDNMKSLLGGAERSRILRNVIRKSIEKGKTNTTQ
jgi:phospholipid/cholesterol/gamma-HCH transport system substrate-binding protein